MNSEKKMLTHHADTEGVLALLDGYISSAMLIAAMEHGLFWLLEKRSRTPEEIAETLNLPLGRCRYWLQYLSTLGFITLESGKYSLTGKSRSGITDAFSQNTWSLLAGEARERFPPFQYFSPYLADPDSMWGWTGLEPPEYVQQMKADPARARRFTQMLYEIHQDLANGIAQQLNLTGVDRIMDLGGGSGVVTIALEALIVDIPNVCDAGAEIVEAEGLSDRVQFLPADFLHDTLPVDFPLILECDVGVYNEIIFEKVRASLRPDGRYIILDPGQCRDLCAILISSIRRLTRLPRCWDIPAFRRSLFNLFSYQVRWVEGSRMICSSSKREYEGRGYVRVYFQ
jgi:SAM-dependent methyltransferase